MKIFYIGDISGAPGREAVAQHLPELNKAEHFDLILANAENAAHGNGLSKKTYDFLSHYIDGFTMGNHTWGNKEACDILDTQPNIIRPANFHPSLSGAGSMVLTAANGYKVGVINLIGQTYMEPVDSPFTALDREIDKLKDETNIILVDFHAEATSEKRALFYYANGRVSAIFGTHTHVQTADEEISSEGTAYLTDLGMTGPQGSVLGLIPEPTIEQFKTGVHQKHEMSTNKGQLCGAIIDVDETTGKSKSIKRIYIK